MGAEDKREFVEGIAREHGAALARFVASRLLREAPADIPDLVQEIYLRLLRVPDHQSIRDPRAYLFTVALHVLHQHRLSRTARPEAIDIAEVLAGLESQSERNPLIELEIDDEARRLDRILSELPSHPYTVFILHRKHGYKREEIAQRLGISLALVKKHLSTALVHCRRRLSQMEQAP